MWTTIKRVTLVLVRERGTMFFITLFPILLVLVLGTALTGVDIAENPISGVNVLYSIDATSQTDVNAAQDYVKGINGDGTVTFVSAKDANVAPSLDNCKQQVSNGDYGAYASFEDNGNVTLYEGTDVTTNQVLEAMMRSYTNMYGAVAQVVSAASSQTAGMGAANVTAAVNSEMTGGSSLVQTSVAGFHRTTMDYYAVAVLVLMLFMGGCIGGAETLYNARRSGTLRRDLLSARPRLAIYASYLLDVLIMNLIQICIVMFFSVLFGAHYADNIGGNILLFAMALMSGMAVAAIFLVVGMFIKVNPMAIIMVPLWVILFMSGTFTSSVSVSSISPYLPPAIIQNAAFNLTIFNQPADCVNVLITCAVILVVAAGVGAFVFNRRKVA